MQNSLPLFGRIAPGRVLGIVLSERYSSGKLVQHRYRDCITESRFVCNIQTPCINKKVCKDYTSNKESGQVIDQAFLAVSYALINDETVWEAIMEPINSRGRSSTFLKRMQDLPMESFLPAFSKATINVWYTF